MQAISKKRILISNDDGIHAPGLKALEEIARELSDDVWIIAPETEQSGAGHSLTLTKPLRIRKLEEKKWAVSGTPTDCVMMALNKIMVDCPPTLILSGINRGGNLAEDVTYSGTVSVAMEGTLGQIPSIALSQCIRPDQPTYWETSKRYAKSVIESLLENGWNDKVLMNVNFPAIPADDVKGVHVTVQGHRDITGNNVEERQDPRGFPYYWFGLGREVGKPGAETDLQAVRSGWISVTPLQLDLTDHRSRDRIAPLVTKEF